MSRLRALFGGLTAALAASLTAGCLMSVSISGSGNLVTLQEEHSGFDRVHAAHAFEVEIRQGPVFSVVVETDDNVTEHLDVQVVGSTLELGLKHGSYSLNNVTLEARVTMPVVTGVGASGASHVHLVDVRTEDRVDIDLSGASSLTGVLDARDLSFDISGASRAELSGSCDGLDIDMSGASNAQLSLLTANDVSIDASGASHASVRTDGSLSVDASGASSVVYSGEPRLRSVDTSGAASIISATSGSKKQPKVQ